MSRRPAGPSKAGYWIGGVIIAAGILGVIVSGGLAYKALVHRVDAFQRVPLTGTEALHLDPGGYVVYYEGSGVPNNVPPITVVVTPSGGLQPLPVSRYGESSPGARSFVTYNIHGHPGQAIATFTIPDPGGDYRIASASPGVGGLAVGPSVAPLLVGGILGALASGGLGLVVGLLVIILTGVKRGRAKRAQAAQPYPGYGYPPYGYPGSYQYPPAGPPGHQPAPTPEYVWPDPYPQGPNPEHVHAPEAGHQPIPRPGPAPEGDDASP